MYTCSGSGSYPVKKSLHGEGSKPDCFSGTAAAASGEATDRRPCTADRAPPAKPPSIFIQHDGLAISFLGLLVAKTKVA